MPAMTREEAARIFWSYVRDILIMLEGEWQRWEEEINHCIRVAKKEGGKRQDVLPLLE